MRRFLVERIEDEAGLFVIKGREAGHIVRVLRMGVGERLILMDRAGKRFEARIKALDQKAVQVLLLRRVPTPPEPPVEIILCQAVLKSQAMDALIQKTSELGVASIHPFTCSRTVIRVAAGPHGQKLRRWQEIADGAAKQADRHWPARVTSCSSFMEIIGLWRTEEATKVILWEQERSADLKQVLRTARPQARFVGVVGPEGGFEPGEIEAAAEAGFLAVSLGERTLRAETAAMTLIALVQYEWGDLSLREKDKG
jgi:16S rRNA (uracil1498-N3)-methyltransferase